MQERQLTEANTLTLREYATRCECSLEVAKFGLLSEFIRKGVTDFYSFKSKGEELAEDEMQVLTNKMHEMQVFFEEIITKIE